MSDFEGSILPRYVVGPSEFSTTVTLSTHRQVMAQFPDREEPVVLSCASDEVMRILQERGGEIVGIERPEATVERLKLEAAAAVESFRSRVDRPRFGREPS